MTYLSSSLLNSYASQLASSSFNAYTNQLITAMGVLKSNEPLRSVLDELRPGLDAYRQDPSLAASVTVVDRLLKTKFDDGDSPMQRSQVYMSIRDAWTRIIEGKPTSMMRMPGSVPVIPEQQEGVEDSSLEEVQSYTLAEQIETFPGPAGIFEVDLYDGSIRVVETNKKNVEISGFTTEELVDHDFMMNIHLSDRARFGEDLNELQAKGTMTSRKIRLLRKGGGYILVDLMAGFLPVRNNRRRGIFYLTDHTESKAAMDKFYEYRTDLERLQKLLLEIGTPISILYLDESENIKVLQSSYSLAKMFGYGPDEFKSIRIRDLFAPDVDIDINETLRTFMMRSSEDGSPVNQPLQWPAVKMRDKKGNVFPVDIEATIARVERRAFSMVRLTNARHRLDKEEGEREVETLRAWELAAHRLGDVVNNGLQEAGLLMQRASRVQDWFVDAWRNPTEEGIKEALAGVKKEIDQYERHRSRRFREGEEYGRNDRSHRRSN